MPGKLLKSQNFKLYLLLLITGLVFGVFTFLYVKDYVGYYKELYTYRTRLIADLTGGEVIKPTFSDGDPYIGNKLAKVVVFEYADFSCEACKSIQPEIKKLVDFYGPEKIMLIWKDLPITGADLNLTAHEAARCAGDQNKFFEYGDQLYAAQGTFSNELFTNIAANLSLNLDDFNMCLNGRKYSDVVENNYRDALQIGLSSAPTIFINNQQLNGGYTFESMRNIAESTK